MKMGRLPECLPLAARVADHLKTFKWNPDLINSNYRSLIYFLQKHSSTIPFPYLATRTKISHRRLFYLIKQ